jgi:hypothetical protein
MKISLHLGAHKTASTFIQEVLERHAPQLLERRILALPMMKTRKNLTKYLTIRTDIIESTMAKRRASAIGYVNEHCARTDVDRIILTDENMIGEPEEMVQTTRLYPTAAQRLTRLAPLLEGHEVEIFLAIRHLGHYSRSIYCENLRWIKGPFVPVEEYKSAWLEGDQTWQDLVGVIRTIFPAARITLWNHHLINPAPEFILNTIASVDDIDYDLKAVYKRRSLSHNATEALIRIGEQEGAEAVVARVEEMRLAHPHTKDNWNYVMWHGEADQRFTKRFREDIWAFRKMAPEIRVLDKPET